MRLAQFILSSTDRILDEWETYARELPASHGLDSDKLRNHAHGILGAIASHIDNAPGLDERLRAARARRFAPFPDSDAARHGAARLAQGFSLDEAVAEMRALRGVVLLLWQDRSGAADPNDEIIRFNEGIDQAMADSLARYSALRDRQWRLFDALLSDSPDLAFIVDTGGKILFANKAFADSVGKPAAELQGACFYALLGAYSPDIGLHVRHALRSQVVHRDELSIATRPGTVAHYEYVLVPVMSPDGASDAVAGLARDITERKAVEERIRRSANYDHLTDLPNRSLFRERLEHEMRHALRSGLPLAVLFIDLDGFKAVNDSLGHAAGDQLLQQVAGRLSGCVRDTDTVARLGGDEFTVVLTEISRPASVEALCAKIIGELSKPFALSAGQARISASIGVTLYPSDVSTLDDLLRRADAAMYLAKAAGRNRYYLFTSRADSAAS